MLDDLEACEYASSLGLAIAGTLGVLLEAKKTGLIDEVTPLMRQLKELGMYIENLLYQRVVTIANEATLY